MGKRFLVLKRRQVGGREILSLLDETHGTVALPEEWTDRAEPSAYATALDQPLILDLTQVERDFRTLKTGLLELRPIFLRKAARTRGHAFVTMLALKLARELEGRVAPLGLTVEDAPESQNLFVAGQIDASATPYVIPCKRLNIRWLQKG